MTAPDEMELRRALRALKQDQAPARDLWTGIESRLQPRVATHPRRRQWPRAGWQALAAAVVLAFGLALVPGLIHRNDGDSTLAGSASSSSGDTGTAAQDTVTVLLTAYDEVLAAEQAEGTAWAGQLIAQPGGADRIAAQRELDASLAQLAAALRLAPESQLLRRLMHQTLQRRAAITLTALPA